MGFGMFAFSMPAMPEMKMPDIPDIPGVPGAIPDLSPDRKLNHSPGPDR